jgi:hypothetical protein
MAKTTAAKKRPDPNTLCLKVTLRDIKPPIWRRILLQGSMTLADLDVAIRVTMGWDGGHLHAFTIGEERYGDPTIIDYVRDERHLTLDALVTSGITRFAYKYDFGDDWDHEILIEKMPAAHATTPAPACIGGKRHGPPEDCGGPWGYADLLDILADPAHPQHQEQIEWLEQDFDPEAFSVADANAALAKALHRKKPRVTGS